MSRLNSKKIIKGLIVLLLLGGSVLLFQNSVWADEASNITVQMTVPSGGGGGGGGGGGEPVVDNVPVISNVVTSTLKNSAQVNWQATDDKGVSSVTFVYGLTLAYGSSGVIAGNYTVDIVGLTAETTYYYKILVTDTGNQTVQYLGDFKTKEEVVLIDNQAPIISNVQTIPGTASAEIVWQTDENADSQVNFGLTDQYGSISSDVNFVKNHSIFLLGLLPNKTYHYRIVSTDSSGNSASTVDATFTTNKDNIAPPDVSNLQLTIGANNIKIDWTNPPLMGTPDFAGVKVVRKIGSSSATVNDGAVVYTGVGQTFTDNNVIEETGYYYTVFSFDTSENYSGGIFKNGTIPKAVQPPMNLEICDNGLDDDNNQKTDCADPACAAFPACVGQEPIGGEGQDGGEGEGGGFQPPGNNLPEFARIDISKVVFLAANNQLKLQPTYVEAPAGEAKIVGLSGYGLRVGVDKNNLISEPKSLKLVIGNDQHQFVFSVAKDTYYADVVFPSGQAKTFIVIDYGENQVDSLDFYLKGLDWGQVTDTKNNLLAETRVELVGADGQRIDLTLYGGVNPLITETTGKYGWMVPNGNYSLVVEKTDFLKRKTPVFSVSNNTINQAISLIEAPEKIEDVIDSDVTILENTKNVAKNLLKRSSVGADVTVQIIQDLKNNPETKQVAGDVVVPTVVAATAVATMIFSWSSLWPLLQFLFLQPLLLLGRKKRKSWGVVYNSLNKLPVDLATVRLLDAVTGRIVQSKVTDANGRYLFSANPGKYKLVVLKNGFTYPSDLLKNFKDDGEMVDIYHGELLEVTEKDAVITANIPLDQAGERKVPSNIWLKKLGRATQKLLSYSGLIVTMFSLYISPKWYVWLLVGAHVVILLIFKRLTKTKKPKGWGIVYDYKTKKPVSKVVTRLFDSQFNKLVDTEITDSKGRYSFLVGGNKYYVTYERTGYGNHKTDVLDLTKEKTGVVAVDVWLKEQEKSK